MFLNFEKINILMAARTESQISTEEEYREYICREVYKNKECGFKVQAKTEEEAMEHALRHREQAHGMTETSPEMEKEIRRGIRPVSIEEEYREYTCPEPGCGFSVQARNEDELIEQAHMHQELEHGVKERSPEIERDIRRDIRLSSTAEGYKEYTCSDPECDFSIRGKNEDQLVEHAHMHQELEHDVERSPKTEKEIVAHITPVTVL